MVKCITPNIVRHKSWFWQIWQISLFFAQRHWSCCLNVSSAQFSSHLTHRSILPSLQCFQTHFFPPLFFKPLFRQIGTRCCLQIVFFFTSHHCIKSTSQEFCHCYFAHSSNLDALLHFEVSREGKTPNSFFFLLFCCQQNNVTAPV